jgi:Brp/Blh family beta-carotene 15,15'-monooxygenase
MLGPLIFHREVYAQVIEATVGLFEPGYRLVLAVEFSWAAGIVLGALLTVYVAALVKKRARWRDAVWDFGETAGLLVLFLLWHPLVSIGLYFIFWHSWRHLVRLVDDIPELRQRREQDSPRLAWVALAGRTLPNTLAAIALLGVLGFAVGGWTEGVYSLVGVYLVLLACLTVPHTVTVWVMDQRDGLHGRR